MHGGFQHLTDDMIIKDAKYVYFIRLPEYGLPPYEKKEETDAEMPSYFIVGCSSGKFLSSLENHLKDVFTTKSAITNIVLLLYILLDIHASD